GSSPWAEGPRHKSLSSGRAKRGPVGRPRRNWGRDVPPFVAARLSPDSPASRGTCFTCFFRSRSGIGSLHGGTRSRAPNGAERATRLWQFYHRSFGTTTSAPTCLAYLQAI